MWCYADGVGTTSFLMESCMKPFLPMGLVVYSRCISRQKVSNPRMIKTTNRTNLHESREVFDKILVGFRVKGVES